MAAAITIDGVSKRYRLYQERNTSLKATVLRRRRAVYKDLWALQDVSFDVAEGQTFGLIGHNGSGKSTLLKCIAKILRPNAGSITTHGKISALLELGAGFHPELSGRDNVYLNASILGLAKKEIDLRFDEIVDFSGLGDRIDTPVKNYSSGMYIRLGFSVAINVDPDILLIDEILTVGDESFQRKCSQKFDDLKESGKTIVIVSHGLSSVKELCDEVALLDHGHLVSIGKPEEVIDTYMGGVEENVRPDGEHGMRFGRGGAIIERVEMLDRNGSPIEACHTGDAITYRIHARAQQPIEQPVFRLEIHNTHGMVIGAANTRYHGINLDMPAGSFTIDYQIDHLLLVPGTYDISATLFDYDLKDPYDVRHRFQRFHVAVGSPPDFDGVTSLGGQWSESALVPKSPA
ncbi:MAG TPA: ABC transporter ATP-binding protein [Acidimicrobiales bacterium]|nr:ABC transporter ATP-binding protein [Acidimicrobiales bacterium]